MMVERLEWEREAHPVREQLRIRKREPYPKEQAILDAEPFSDETVIDALRGFQDTSTNRQIGLAIGPIPDSAIWDWCDRHGLDAEAAQIFHRGIRIADDAFLDRLRKEPKKP